jgi:hypothetical protein
VEVSFWTASHLKIRLPICIGFGKCPNIARINVKIKVKVLCASPEHHAMKASWGSGGIAPHILDLDTRWRG